MTARPATEPKNNLAALIKNFGQTKLANELGVSLTAVSVWMKKGYVPAGKLIRFCNTLNIDLDLALCDRPDKVERSQRTLNKPAGTLECLVEVQRGAMTIDEAAEQLDLSPHALQIAYAQNEHRLFLLYSTLTAFADERINVQEAAKALGVSKTQVYYLMRTYGMERPKRQPEPKELGRYTKAKPKYEKLALDVIAGRTNALRASQEEGVAERTLHRHIKRLIGDLSLNVISHWPKSFRLAFANELETGERKWVEKWVEYTQKHGLILEKRVRKLQEVVNWREVGPTRILIAVLQGEGTLDEIATLRRGAQKPLKSAFDGVLKAFDLRYDEAMTLSVWHQMALADILVMQDSHYRRSA